MWRSFVRDSKCGRILYGIQNVDDFRIQGSICFAHKAINTMEIQTKKSLKLVFDCKHGESAIMQPGAAVYIEGRGLAG